MTRAEALATARSVFPAVIGAPNWRPLELPAGARLVSYVGSHAARVDVGLRPRSRAPVPPGAGDPAVLLESTLPLRARNAAGSLAPVNLDLQPGRRGFASINPLVPATVGRLAGEGIRFDDIATTIVPRGPGGAVRGALADGKVFYANVAGEDTDVIVQAIPAGVEILWQLRSPNSPQAVRKSALAQPELLVMGRMPYGPPRAAF